MKSTDPNPRSAIWNWIPKRYQEKTKMREKWIPFFLFFCLISRRSTTKFETNGVFSFSSLLFSFTSLFWFSPCSLSLSPWNFQDSNGPPPKNKNGPLKHLNALQRGAHKMWTDHKNTRHHPPLTWIIKRNPTYCLPYCLIEKAFLLLNIETFQERALFY